MKFLENQNLQQLMGTFEREGYQIRVVGGAVRDYLVGVEGKDIDFCTDATPDEMIAIADRHKIHYIPTGLQHGTITFVINHEPFEITTLRIDVETDGRHAEVAFTRSFSEDAKRRDLTINAMSVDRHGQLFDYFDGQYDLKNNRVRFVGNAEERIREDFLRILRYYRFMGRFGISFSTENLSYSQSHQTIFMDEEIHNGLRKISGERIWMELKKILSGPNATVVVASMIETGVLQACLDLPTHYSDGWFKPYYAPNYFMQVAKLEEICKANELEKDAILMAKLASFYPLEIMPFNAPMYPLIHLDKPSDFVTKINNRLKLSSFEHEAFKFMFDQIVNKLEGGGSFKHTIKAACVERCYKKEALVAVGGVLSNGLVRKMGGVIPDFSEASNFYKVFKRIPEMTISGKDLIKLGVKPGPQMGIMLRYFRLMLASQYLGDTPEAINDLSLIKKTFEDQDISKLFFERVTIATFDQMLGNGIQNYFHRTKGLTENVKVDYDKEYQKVRDFYQKLTGDTNDLIDIEPDIAEYSGSDTAIILVWKDRESAILAKLKYGAP